jgi:predicted lipid carrier protein YhbT
METYSQAQPSLLTRLKLNIKRGIVQAPAKLLKPISYLPHELQQQSINLALNQVLKTAIANKELGFLGNKWLKVNITDVPYNFYISVNQAQVLEIRMSLQQQADVCFVGDSQSLLQLMSRDVDPDTLFFQRKLLVTGDTELGLEIKNFLDDMDLSQLPSVIQTGLTKYNKWTSDLQE